MGTPARIDLAVISPVLLGALADALRREGVEVLTAAPSWVEFSRSWDFAAPSVLVDAHLDDHVPLILKVRALLREGSRVAVLGRDGASRQARRCLREGAEIWLTPQQSLSQITRRLAAWARSDPPTIRGSALPEPHLTDRELQILSLYASRRGHTVAEVAKVLGLSSETVRTHLRTGRAKYTALGQDVSSRARLTRVLVDDGLVEDPDLWSAMQRW